MKVIYTRAKLRGAVPDGVQVRNPRFFNGPEPGVTEVYLNGDFPVVSEAYAKVGVDARPLAALDCTSPAPDQLLRPGDQKLRRKH